jgi:acyl carrier protein
VRARLVGTVAVDDAVTSALDEVAISTWLVARVADLLDEPPEVVELGRSLEDVGLESSDVVVLMIDLSDLVGQPVSPVVLWDHPTVASLAAFLAAVVRGEAELPDDLLDLDFG